MRRHPHPATWCAIAAAWAGLLVAASCSPEPLRTGDDDRDGVIREDETGWRCDVDGNRQCAPGAELAT